MHLKYIVKLHSSENASCICRKNVAQMVIKKSLKFFSLKKISYFRPDKSLAKGKQLLNRSSYSVIQGQRKHQSMSFRGLYNKGGDFKSFKKSSLGQTVGRQLSATQD